MLNGHGDDLYRYPGREMLNFSSNIPGGTDHTHLREHLLQTPGLFSSYPQPDAGALAQRLGPEGCVAVTAGATEAIYLIANAWQGALSAIVRPTFSEYEDACRLNGHTVISGSLTGDFLTGTRPRLMWLCTPNNPTGESVPPELILTLADANPHIIFVVDLAYAHYCTRPTLRTEHAVARPNLLLLHSLTKRFSVPGLRIGYVVGNPALISAINSRRMPWSVNSIAIEAAQWLLDNADKYPVDYRALNREACRVRQCLITLGLDVLPTECNYMLCRLPAGLSATRLKADLAQQGLLIRDASNFTGLTPSHFRIAVQGREADDLLIEKIRLWLELNLQ